MTLLAKGALAESFPKTLLAILHGGRLSADRQIQFELEC